MRGPPTQRTRQRSTRRARTDREPEYVPWRPIGCVLLRHDEPVVNGTGRADVAEDSVERGR